MMSSHELILRPSGRLVFREGCPADPNGLDAWTRRVARGFASCQAAGLFALAASRPDVPPSPSLSFWCDISCRYLTQLCRTPEHAGRHSEPMDPPGPEEIGSMLAGAPPMEGGEYLCADILQAVWMDLDAWIHESVKTSGLGLSEWLTKRAPRWHQVGRVCFHLAENKRDPEFPFAFMATYAPQLSRSGRVQYRPLGKALQEYAGVRNKKALIALLTPVHRAAEKSGLVKELVESGDVFHPLSWTPGEAYRFLKEVPDFEESGLLVRLPDWWRKRPRARAAVTIGDRKQARFGADAMLDFRVDLSLGDQRLTEEERQRRYEAAMKPVQAYLSRFDDETKPEGYRLLFCCWRCGSDAGAPEVDSYVSDWSECVAVWQKAICAWGPQRIEDVGLTDEMWHHTAADLFVAEPVCAITKQGVLL